MATKTTQQSRPRSKLSAEEQVVRLRSQLARLRAELRALKSSATPSPKSQVPTSRRKGQTPAAVSPPALPATDSDGNYPATETLRAILAQQLVRRREAAGWTQAELAARAGVRQETVSRLESGKNAPNVTTVDKLDRALKEAGV